MLTIMSLLAIIASNRYEAGLYWCVDFILTASLLFCHWSVYKVSYLVLIQ